MHTYTRRTVIGVAATGAASAAFFGRYAFGDTFERHLAGTLGVSLESARALARHAEAEVGSLSYNRLATSFLAATTPPGEFVLPRDIRRRAVHAFLSEAVTDSHGNLVLLGLLPGDSSAVCRGLLPG